MAEVIFRLPGREQYSYAEVKFSDGEPIDLEVIKDALENLNATFPNAASQSSAGAYSAPVASQRASSGHTCDHGERVRKSGTSAKGPWVAWFCPEKDKGQQCKPEWEK